MPRRSSRFSASGTRTKKRAVEERPTTTSTTVKRLRSTNNKHAGEKGRNSSSTRSKYFHAEAPDSSPGDLSSELSQAEASDDLSEYGGDESLASGVGSDADDAESTNNGAKEEPASEADGKNRRKRKASGPTKGKELWREGMRTGLGPGKEVFIELPKARDPGDIPYEDHRIHPNTMLFLRDLKVNNNRGWFKMHDTDYRASKKDWETFVESFTEKISEKDSTVPELPAKDLVFRVHRDVRFSKDQTPYKPHFSAAWSRTGRKAAGVWMPEEPRLSQLRADVDRNPHKIKRVLNNDNVRREFFGGIPSDEKKAVKAFVSQNQEGALKTKPKAYPADHRDIELLRLRSYTLGKKLRDEDVLDANAQDRLANLIGILVPFVTWINSVVMPDDPDEDDDSGEEGDGNSDQEEGL